MRRQLVGLLIGAALCSNACTTWQYSGQIDARTSDGRDVKALAHWQKTHRALWFDTVSGAVRVQTQCSLNTLVYSEREDGIVLALTPELELAEGVDPQSRHCGRVLDAERIGDLDTGELRVEVRCVAAIDEFSAVPGRKPFIAARAEPWVFTIERTESPRAPKVAACTEP